MAGEEEADSIELLLQPFGWQPRLDLGQTQRAARSVVSEGELERTTLLGLQRTLRFSKHGIDRGKDAGAVALERVEGAGGGEAFHHALVDGARIDAGREIGQVSEQ